MFILVIGVIFALGLMLLPRLLGRRQAAMLEQYEILEKRFLLKRKVYPSKWGKGIGERYALSGDYGGYSVSLYDYFHQSESSKQVWTGLSFEMLFAGELELAIEPEVGDEAARFEALEPLEPASTPVGRFRFKSNAGDSLEGIADDALLERFERFQGRGSFRLSKGFFEYRESGLMEDAETRIHFQEAIPLLARLGDRLKECLHAS